MYTIGRIAQQLTCINFMIYNIIHILIIETIALICAI